MSALIVAAVVAVSQPAPEPTSTESSLAGLTPLNAFVPPDARPDVGLRVPATPGIPRQLLVEWERGGSAGDPFTWERGISVWQAGLRDRNSWTRVYSIHVAPGYGPVRVDLGDLTGDGHADLLLAEDDGGTGDCGPRRVLADVGGQVRQIFGRLTCDTEFAIRRLALVSVGAAYSARDGHCCPTFTRRSALRWNGKRFRAVSTALYFNCFDRRVCGKWPKGPLRFAPRFREFWDGKRGVSVGGERPWLIARTVDGGKSWQVVDAAPCPLARPALRRKGAATLTLACGKTLRTADFGISWR